MCQDRVISGSDETAEEPRRLAEKRAFDRLAERVGDARPDVRAEAAISLGRSGQDRGALAAIDELLHVPAHPKRYHLAAAVEKLCKSVDAEISSRAAAVATRFIRRNLANCGASLAEANLLANNIRHCLDGITAAGAPDEQEILREVVASRVDWWVRGLALKRLAQLEGSAGISRLVDALMTRPASGCMCSACA